MGFFDKIKQIYNKADKAVGGYLPGGSTPSEVKASKSLPTATAKDVLQVTRPSGPTTQLSPEVNKSLGISTQRAPTTSEKFTQNTSKPPTEPTFSYSPTSSVKKSTGSKNVSDTRQTTIPETQESIPEQQQIDNEGFQPDVAGPTSPLSSETKADLGITENETSLEAQGFNKTMTGLYEKDGRTYMLDTNTNQVIPVSGGVNPVLSMIDPKRAVLGLGKKAFNAYNKWKASKKMARDIAIAEKAGQRIIATNKFFNNAFRMGDTTFTNTKQASMINQIMIDTAKEVNPNTATIILGWVKSNSGKLVAGAALSELVNFGMMIDLPDRANIAASQASQAGDTEGANELYDLADDAAEWNKNIISKLPFIQLPKTFKMWYDEHKEITKVGRDANEKEIEKQTEKSMIDELNEELNTTRGSWSDADWEAYAIANPYSGEAKAWADKMAGETYRDPNTGELVAGLKQQAYDESEAEQRAYDEARQAEWDARDAAKRAQEKQDQADKDALSQASVDESRNLVDRIIDPTTGEVLMTAEQIVADPAMRAHAQNANNWSTAMTDIYKDAQANIARDFGSSGSGSSGTYEAPSTLNFGLLETGPTESYTKDDELIQEELSLNDRALELFGLRYEQLTDAQKKTLE